MKQRLKQIEYFSAKIFSTSIIGRRLGIIGRRLGIIGRRLGIVVTSVIVKNYQTLTRSLLLIVAALVAPKSYCLVAAYCFIFAW